MYRKNIEIQFLRVVAIAMVILMHLPVGMFSPYREKYSVILSFIHPAVGVDIFFVISGYLMGLTFINRTESANELSEKITLTSIFYLRRFWRLFPAAFFWITITLIIGCISKDPELWLTPLALYKKWVASVLCFRNFEVSLYPTHLGYYWSLSLENQFYLLLPLAWFFLIRKWFWKIIIGLCIMCLFWRPGGATWWLFRFDGLLMGMLIYKMMTFQSFKNAIHRISPDTVPGKILMTAFFCLTIPSIPIAIGSYPAVTWSFVALCSSFLISQAVLNEGIIYIPKILYSFIYWAGEFSYSIYLCHIPVWLILKDISKRYFNATVNPYILFFAGMILITLLSAATYFYIEQPCIQFGKKLVKATPEPSNKDKFTKSIYC